MEDLERERTQMRPPFRDPEQLRRAESIESLKLARKELEGQLAATSHERRRAQIAQAIEEVNRRIAEVSGPIV